MANLENIWKDEEVTITTKKIHMNALVFQEGNETNRQLGSVVLEEDGQALPYMSTSTNRETEAVILCGHRACRK